MTLQVIPCRGCSFQIGPLRKGVVFQRFTVVQRHARGECKQSAKDETRVSREVLEKCLFLSLRVCLAHTVRSPHFHHAFDSRSRRVRHAIVSIRLNFRFKYLSPGISPLNYAHMYIHVGLTSNGRINIQVSHCSLIK